MEQWIETHGRVPMWDDWEHATQGRPCAKTVERRWGWDAFRAEAVGVSRRKLSEVAARARPGFSGRGWPGATVLRPLIEHYAREGHWPGGNQWEAATAEHPSRRTYVRRFGSWQQAVDAAARELSRVAVRGFAERNSSVTPSRRRSSMDRSAGP